MTTPELPGATPAPAPEEFRVAASWMPAASQSPPTPGVSHGVTRAPTAPTVAEPDPSSFTALLARVANELFSAPPTAPAAPAQPAPITAPAQPAQVAAPAAPSPPAAPVTSPFEAPLNFDAFTAHAPVLREPMLAPTPTSHAAPAAPATGLYWLDAQPAVTAHAQPAHTQLAPAQPAVPAHVQPAVPAHVQPAPTAPSIPSRVEVLDLFAEEPAADPSLRERARGPFDPHAIRREFPILEERVHGRRLVWLDNAATTQKPRAVIDRLARFYERENSNIHRAAHTLAARATDAYEKARETVRRFVNAPSVDEIVFVRGATEGINLVAQSWGRRHVQPGDEIVVTWLEHHANIVPWQQLCAERGARLRVAPVDDHGQVLLDEYERLLNPRTRLVAITQVSNALGTVTPAAEMTAMAHRHGAHVLLDGAQAVSHMRVDVQALGCDFLVFSGHKVFGPTGIGAVFGRREVLASMPPWQGGGNMIEDVTFERTRFHGPPARFEAGTGNIADAVGLGAALEWLERVGIEQVNRYEHELLVYGTERLARVPGLRMIGTAPEKAGVLSFVLAGQKTEAMGALLDREGIAVRSGHHCAQPILRRFGVEATVRASLAPYNTCEDLDALVEALQKIQAGRGTSE